MDKKKIFIFLTIFWLVIIGGFIGYKEYTLRTGQEVLLGTMPVDPRDLFRGDYVILDYEISNVNLNSVSSDRTDFKPGDRIYVTLSVDNENYALASGVYSVIPQDDLFIRGIVKNIRNNHVAIEYGIESYFVPEGEGREIERQIWRGDVDAKVVIDKQGRAVIKTLFIGGQEVRFN